MTLSNVEWMLLRENKKKDNRALGLIQQVLDDVILSKFSNVESSKKAWDTLESCYQGLSKVKNVKLENLRRDFKNLKMIDNKIVDEFMTQVMSLGNRLRQYSEDLSNKRRINKVLQSFPMKFESIVVSLQEFKDTSQIQIEELTSSLIAYESRMSRYGDRMLENAFKTQSQFNRGGDKGRSSNTWGGGRVADPTCPQDNYDNEEKYQQCPYNLRGGKNRTWHRGKHRYDMSKLQCYYCKRYGHLSTKCLKRQVDASKQFAHIAKEFEDNQKRVFMTCNMTHNVRIIFGF